jgi:hypothetical protein
MYVYDDSSQRNLIRVPELHRANPSTAAIIINGKKRTSFLINDKTAIPRLSIRSGKDSSIYIPKEVYTP